MLRVIVIEDSLTVRHLIRKALARAGDIEVIGEAEDGKEGIELCRRLRPDVITLDLVLPVMSGIAVTEYIMAYQPTPILIVSASSNRDEAHRTYDALAAGAVDVLEKIPSVGAEAAWEDLLIASVRMVSRITVMTHPKGRRRPVREPLVSLVPSDKGSPSVVAFGTSTGGPGAMSAILKSLVHPFPLPILVVQHLSPAFSHAYGEWLDRQSDHRVSYAHEGESLANAHGRVIMAPPDRHLMVRGGQLRLTSDPERNFCRPSVDILFESLAEEIGAGTVAVLLTGMGKDGATGLLRIRNSGGATIAQDEESSTVYGMPREAALSGAAEVILPLAEIGRAVSDLVRKRERS